MIAESINEKEGNDAKFRSDTNKYSERLADCFRKDSKIAGSTLMAILAEMMTLVDNDTIIKMRDKVKNEFDLGEDDKTGKVMLDIINFLIHTNFGNTER